MSKRELLAPCFTTTKELSVRQLRISTNKKVMLELIVEQMAKKILDNNRVLDFHADSGIALKLIVAERRHKEKTMKTKCDTLDMRMQRAALALTKSVRSMIGRDFLLDGKTKQAHFVKVTEIEWRGDNWWVDTEDIRLNTRTNNTMLLADFIIRVSQ